MAPTLAVLGLLCITTIRHHDFTPGNFESLMKFVNNKRRNLKSYSAQFKIISEQLNQNHNHPNESTNSKNSNPNGIKTKLFYLVFHRFSSYVTANFYTIHLT